jgi:SAM-dependent methyltransferase
MSWTAGYVSEVEYTYGYYRELSPSLQRLACLSAGIGTSASDKLNYLELGFGQGLSINIHAAAHDGEFWGTDFNPTQAAHARALADASGSGARLLDDSFSELTARADLPEFDVIALHGVWSWISEENRRAVVALIRRKLRVGGIAYVSYNCLPGWAPAMPLRHIMTLHSELAGSEAAGLVGKIEDALKFTQKLIDSGALYFRANTAVAERLKKIVAQNRNYLAHEYFNLDWDIMAFSDVARMLDEAKVTFAASAYLLDHVEAVNLTKEGQELLASISQPILRQSVRDYFVNQQFRRDIFVKGVRQLSAFERSEALRQQKFVLVNHPSDIPLTVTGSLGQASLQEQAYLPLIEILAENSFVPKSLGEIAANPKNSAIQANQLLQAILVLVGAGHVAPTQEPPRQARHRCASLNRYLCERSRGSADITVLASPVTASGIGANRFHQLFLLAAHAGNKSPTEQATYVWKTLESQGQRVIKDGKTLQTADENMEALMRDVMEFTDKRLPVLKALGVTLSG